MIRIDKLDAYDNPDKLFQSLENNSRTFKCKCGHTEVIPAQTEKVICSWCKNYVFSDKKLEFEYRLKEAIRKRG